MNGLISVRLGWLLFWLAAWFVADSVAAQPWRPMTGEISGMVLAPGGKPLAKAKVRLSGERTAVSSSTSNGRFLFTSLPAGTYSVEVLSEGRVSSWAEEIAVAEGQILRLKFVLAEGKETSVTVTSAPVLDGSPAGPVWRLSRGQLAPLVHGGGPDLWLQLTALRPEMVKRSVLIDGFASSPLALLEPEWIEEIVSYPGAAPATSAGSVRGEEIVLLTHRPKKVWSGRAEIGHQSRDLEGRDRKLTTAGAVDPDRVLVDQDRTRDRGSLAVGGGATESLRIGLAHAANREHDRQRVGSCSECEPHRGTVQRGSLDLSRLSAHWMRPAWQFQGSVTTLDGEGLAGALGTSPNSGNELGRDEIDRDHWLMRSEFQLTNSLRGHVSLASQELERSFQGFQPGSSGRAFLAGVGGVPARSAGGEDLIASGTGESAESPRSGLVFLEASGRGLGAHRIRLGAANERSERDMRESRRQDFVLWEVAPTLGSQLAPLGHVLAETTEIDFEGRRSNEALFVEDLLQVGRLSARVGLRLQRSSWRSRRQPFGCVGCRIDLRDEWLPRLALALDPRGLGQERLTFEVGRYAGSAVDLVPLLAAAAGARTLLALPLAQADLGLIDRSQKLFEGSTGGVLFPSELNGPRSLQASLGAEHLLLPGFMVSGSLTARRYERSPGAQLLPSGALVVGDRGAHSPDGPCRRAETELRLRAGWRGSAGGLEAQADAVRAHGMRSAVCLDAVALPGLQRPQGVPGFSRLRLFGHKDLSERWTLAVASQFSERVGTELGWRQTIDRGRWLEQATPLETQGSSLWSVDLAVRHRRPIAGADGLALVATLEVLNLFDGRSAESFFTGVLLSPDVDGASGVNDPRAGLPSAVQEARAVRLGVGVSF